jgi:hypothetical protein
MGPSAKRTRRVRASARLLPGVAAHDAEALQRASGDLKTKFAAIRDHIATLRNAAAEREATLRGELDPEALRGEASLRREELRRQRREQMKHGARDVGEGLVRAWGEMSAAFRKAATRIRAEDAARRDPASGATPPASDRSTHG